MWRAIYAELIKTYAKPRTYIGVIAVIIIIGLIQIGYYSNQDNIASSIKRIIGDSISIENLSINGNYICYFVLQMLYIHLPIIIALVAGDSVSGEKGSGTIRALMTKPLSRSKIFIAKLIANQIYVLTICFTILVFGLWFSKFIFGDGDMLIASDGISSFSESELTPRFLQAIALSFLTLSVVSSLAFMLSCFYENSIAPIVITMLTIIVFTIIGALEFGFFDNIQNLLFTKHMALWNYCFDFEPDSSELYGSIKVLTIYILGFLSIAYYKFTNQDITQ
jgi:ABC-2 type transport system permease protein